MPIPPPSSKLSHVKRILFLTALAKTNDVDRACKDAEVSWQAVYRLRDQDPDFKARWVEVVTEAFKRRVAVAKKGNGVR